jgi:short-subunit dehydrogenase
MKPAVMDLRGRRVLITGASRGIGKDLVRGFAAAGAQVALVARGADPLHALAAEHGGRAYPTDLTDRDAVRALIARVEADGPVDVLINNAGDECIGRFTSMDADTLELIVHLNALATAELCRQALPRMLARGEGRLVNVSSFAGIVCPPHLAAYAATKAFVTHLSVNLAFELKDTPITCTKVEIGEVADTGLMDKGRTEPELAGMFDRMYRLRMSRLITPAEITAATIDAVRRGRASVRLPRRLAPASYLSDVPRRMPWLTARGLTTPPPFGGRPAS